MSEITIPISQRQLAVLFIIGFLIIFGFFAALEGLRFYTDILGHGGGDVFLAFAPFCLIPYVIIICIYVGFVMSQASKGKERYLWLWAIVGFVMTAAFIISPILLDQLSQFIPLRYLIYFAPALSTLVTILLINLGSESSRVK